MADKIGIILVNYNGENFQNDCVRSIFKSSYSSYEVIVVDNGSTDNSVKKLRAEFPQVKLLLNNNNFGVAKGNNIGIKYALSIGCNYVLLLNNDTVIRTDTIELMIKKAGEAVIVVPKIYYFDKKDMIWFAGGKISWERALTVHYGLNTIDTGRFYNEEKYIEYAPTCCMLIHKSIFEQVGMMDENYFMYFDDTDFCVRARKAGIKILFAFHAVIFHKVSCSSGGKDSPTVIYYMNRNRLYFIKKFYGKKKFFEKNIAIFFYYGSRSIRLVLWLVTNQKMKVKMLVRAIKDNYVCRMKKYQE